MSVCVCVCVEGMRKQLQWEKNSAHGIMKQRERERERGVD